MKYEFPPRYYAGHVQRVNPDGSLVGMVEVGFNVHVAVRLQIEGLSFRGLGKVAYDAAMHCMLVLVGGKDFVALLPYQDNTSALARLYLAARVRDPAAPGLVQIEGCPSPVLDVAAFMVYIASNNYDVALVKRALNGAH